MGRLVATAVVCGAVFVMSQYSEAHEAVVIPVDNGNGVIKELCVMIAEQAMVIDDLDAGDTQKVYDNCVARAATNMTPRHYDHEHS